MTPTSRASRTSLLLLCGFVAASLSSVARGDGAYHLADTFHLGGEGGWDYVTLDSGNHIVYVTRSSHTLAIDGQTGTVLADIAGQQRSHGVALVPSSGHGFITDGNAGTVIVFDLKTYKVLGKIKAADDADGIIYDKGTNKVLIGCGDRGVLIPISGDADPVTGVADPAIDLGGKPEFLAADGHGMAYVNLVDKGMVAAVDLKSSKVIARWPTAPGGSPVGLAIDPERRRLFVGCRNPNMMVIMSADDGKILASLPIGAGVDATAFDGRAFASTGDGNVTIINETSPGKFEVEQTVATARGARTMGVDTGTHTLYFPTAEFEAPTGSGRPPAKPGTFKILVVSR
jgi:DNA-binding beta-propeller fold protein YncE